MKDDLTYWNKVAGLTANIKDDYYHEWLEIAPLYNVNLGAHEWKKHGTCMYEDIVSAAAKSTTAVVAVQERYFDDLYALFKRFPTPSLLSTAATSGAPLTVQQLQGVFGGEGYAMLGCNKDSYGKVFLNMVSICLHRDLQGNPTSQIRCPDVSRWDLEVHS